ncbi:MAG: hypothetical protein ACTSO9_11925 [Candidatus Helarchaeota archaeon]
MVRRKKIALISSLIILFQVLILLSSNFNSLYCFNFNTNKFEQFVINIESWQQNGNPVCTDESKQSLVHMITIENGSVFLIWKDQRNEPVNGDIYGQIIDVDGNTQWDSGGRILINANGTQNPKGLIYSELNCAIFVWEDNRYSDFDIYIQKINLTSGELLWSANGTAICNESNDQTNPDIIGDNNGGAIITWIDERSGSTTLFVQRINSTGHTLWIDNGTLICNKTNSIINSPQIAIDGLNGSIVAWYDNRTGNNSIYCQKINYTGAIQWLANGTPILTLDNLTLMNLKICEDGMNGSIITWSDNRTGNEYKLYIQRINSSGYIQWANNGLPVCNKTSGNQEEVEIINNGDQEVILVWKDDREGSGNSNIFSQKLNLTGDNLWDENGTAVCEAENNQYNPQLIMDGEGGALFTWKDDRSSNFRIYAQRINSTGHVNWTSNGLLVCESIKTLDYPIIAYNSASGCYIAWIDKRSDELGDIYIQRIFINGTFLYTVSSQIFPFFPEPARSIFEQGWFYAIISIVIIDILLVYYLIKKREEKIIERKI